MWRWGRAHSAGRPPLLSEEIEFSGFALFNIEQLAKNRVGGQRFTLEVRRTAEGKECREERWDVRMFCRATAEAEQEQ